MKFTKQQIKEKLVTFFTKSAGHKMPSENLGKKWVEEFEDSIQTTEIAVRLVEYFGIDLPDQMYDKTIDGLADMIEAYSPEARSGEIEPVLYEDFSEPDSVETPLSDERADREFAALAWELTYQR